MMQHEPFARPDFDRLARTGIPEVIFGLGKLPDHLVSIATKLVAQHGRVLTTRISDDQMAALKAAFPDATHHELARCVTIGGQTAQSGAACSVGILAAGTSDLSVAEEAAVTLEFEGIVPQRFYDVGVAGLHRLLETRKEWERCKILIAVAGMEGALPSVVAGLTHRPVIAVPTSVGYGTSFQGMTALLAMLNSCASGLSVVNVDNGFGAAMMALKILKSLA